MRKFKHVLLALFLLMGLMATTAVFAEEGDDTHAAETHDDGYDEDDAHGDDHADDDHAVEVTTTSMVSSGDNFASGFTLGLLALVLLVIFAVAIISAVALGIIGLGYWQSSAGD